MTSTLHPKVSVVIPTYNRAGDVVRAVRSALSQTIPPHQVIVVDDGSTDDTEAVVKALPAPVVYVRKDNGGVSSARNLGFQHVTGDFVALLDSDDQWEARWLEVATLAVQRHPGAGAALSTRVWIVGPDGTKLRLRQLKGRSIDGLMPLEQLMEGGAMGSNLLIRTSVLRQVGDFDATLKTGEDIDYALRLVATASIVSVEEPLVLVTHSVVSLSKSIDTGNRLRVYDKFERLFPELAAEHKVILRQSRANATLGYALDLTVDRQLAKARSRAVESWRYQPSFAAAKQLGKIALLQVAKRFSGA